MSDVIKKSPAVLKRLESSLAQAQGSECRYIIGSGGQCPKAATHTVSLKGRHKMEVCDEHAALYRRPGHKHTYIVEPIPNTEVSSGEKTP